MSKRTKILAAAAAIALLVFTLSTTVMSVVMLVNQSNVNRMIAVYTGQLQDPEQEDDVVIGMNYTIKSTTHISDAYKSGDTSKLRVVNNVQNVLHARTLPANCAIVRISGLLFV